MNHALNHVLRAAVASTLALALTAGARAAEPPPSIITLFKRIPELPATAQEAARWVDARGHLVHAGMLALQADIEAHQRTVERIGRSAGEHGRAQAAVTVEDLGKGLSDVGIDMARMRSDPAYARQVQERMRKMSAQEVMAMSQKMAQPMKQDKRRQNAAQAIVDDSPAVRAAAEAGEIYRNAQAARLKAHEAIWREADEAATRIRHRPLAVPLAKPAMESENPGCNAGCRTQWDAYASAVLPLMVARDTEILQVHRAALQRHRAAVADELATADRQLAASQYGAASRSQVNQTKIIGYDGAAVAELLQMLARITDSVRSAAAVAHCGKQIVLAPGAVCR